MIYLLYSNLKGGELMSQNIIEYLRQESINNLFNTSSFSSSWATWKPIINSYNPSTSSRNIIDLGDKLSQIFTTTAPAGRDNKAVSTGGNAWEALVCWYLNLCSIGRRTVVIKHSKKLIPPPISDAITVTYNTFASNTESDLVAITFPDKPEYSIPKESIVIKDTNGNVVPTVTTRTSRGTTISKFNYLDVINALVERDFNEIEIHIIQCKTNWNDNAQIPMLWDMVYSATTFKRSIYIGQNGYSINNAKDFTYSFVTVPTISADAKASLNPNSTCVRRVNSLSGGNYWGLPTKSGVASSLKEMLTRNLANGHANSHLTSLSTEIANISTTYSYFNF